MKALLPTEPRRPPKLKKVQIRAEVEEIDDGPMVDKTFEFTLDMNGGGDQNVVRAGHLRKKVALDCLVPPDLICIKVIRPDEWSDDDGDLPYIDEIKGLPDHHTLDTKIKHVCTIEKTFRRTFPKNVTCEALDASSAYACEEYLFCDLWKDNPHFCKENILFDAINDVWERLHLANAILKYRRILPKAWFDYTDQYGTNCFIKACFCREDLSNRFLDEGFVDTKQLNQMNHHGQSALTAAIYTGFTGPAVKILNRPDLDMKVMVESGSENMMKGFENNCKMAWRLYEHTQNGISKQVEDEKFHEDVIKTVLAKNIKEETKRLSICEPGWQEKHEKDPVKYKAMHDDVLHGKRGYVLDNPWADIRETMFQLMKKKDLPRQKILGVVNFGETEVIEHTTQVESDKQNMLSKGHPGSSRNPFAEGDSDSESDSSDSEDDGESTSDGGETFGSKSSKGSDGTNFTKTTKRSKFTNGGELDSSDEDFEYVEVRSKKGSMLSRLFGFGGPKTEMIPIAKANFQQRQAHAKALKQRGGAKAGSVGRGSNSMSGVSGLLMNREDVVKGNPYDIYDRTWLDNTGRWHLDDGELPPQRRQRAERLKMRNKALVALKEQNDALELIESGVLLLPAIQRPNLPKGCMVSDDPPATSDRIDIYEDGEWKEWGNFELVRLLDRARYEGDLTMKKGKYTYDLIAMTRNHGGVQRILKIIRGDKDPRGLLNPMFVAEKHPRYNEKMGDDGFKDYSIGWDQVKVAQPHYTALGHLYPQKLDVIAEYQQQELWQEARKIGRGASFVEENKHKITAEKQKKMKTVKDPVTGLMRSMTSDSPSWGRGGSQSRLGSRSEIGSEHSKKSWLPSFSLNPFKKKGSDAANGHFRALPKKEIISGSNVEKIVQTMDDAEQKKQWKKGKGQVLTGSGLRVGQIDEKAQSKSGWFSRKKKDLDEGVRSSDDPITHVTGTVDKPELSQHEENLAKLKADPVTATELEAAAMREARRAETRGKGFVGGTGDEEMDKNAVVDNEGKALTGAAAGMSHEQARAETMSAGSGSKISIVAPPSVGKGSGGSSPGSKNSSARKRTEPKPKMAKRAETREAGADEYEGWNAPKANEIASKNSKGSKKSKASKEKSIAF